jgi:hypothetical protein
MFCSYLAMRIPAAHNTSTIALSTWVISAFALFILIIYLKVSCHLQRKNMAQQTKREFRRSPPVIFPLAGSQFAE